MGVEERLQELGLELPAPPEPAAAYIPAVRAGDLLFISGQLPWIKGELRYKGKVGKELTVEQGQAAARLCALNALSIAKAALGNLDLVERVVQVSGFVASADGFTDQPQVINGASELLIQAFGEKGRHARMAIGTNELPRGTPVEIAFIFQVRGP